MLASIRPFLVDPGYHPMVVVNAPVLPWPLDDERFHHVNVHVEAADGSPDPVLMAAEIRRVLVPGGTFVVSFTAEQVGAALAAGGFEGFELSGSCRLSVIHGRR